MIPAILSSIFVLFLYWKLNATEATSDGSGSDPMRSLRDEIASLNARLDALQAKLQRKT
jgi:hypothetical protein